MRAHVAAIASLIVTAACAIASAEESDNLGTQIRFRTVNRVLIIVPVLVNGVGPFKFLLDTGAEVTGIHTDVARRLNLETQHSATLTTFSDQQEVGVVVASLQVGSLPVERVHMVVHDVAAIPKLSEPIDGILGQNFLSRFNYLIDYRDQTLTLDQRALPATREGSHIPFERLGGRLLLRCILHAGSLSRFTLLLDSGADAVVLIHGSMIADPFLRNESQGSKVRTAKTLTIGTERLNEVTVVIPHERDINAGVSHDGLLPTSLFDSIYVNNNENYVSVDSRAITRLGSAKTP